MDEDRAAVIRKQDIASGIRAAMAMPCPLDRLRAFANCLLLDAMRNIGVTIVDGASSLLWTSVSPCDRAEPAPTGPPQVPLANGAGLRIDWRGADDRFALIHRLTESFQKEPQSVQVLTESAHAAREQGQDYAECSSYEGSLPNWWTSALPHFQPLKARLDDLIRGLHEYDEHRRPRTMSGTSLRAFCVARHHWTSAPRIVRSPTGDAIPLHYTASIIPSALQCEEIDSCVNTEFVRRLKSHQGLGPAKDLPENASDLFTTPLHAGSRAIADSVFASGCIDYSLPDPDGSRDERDHATHDYDRLRGAIETKIYNEQSSFRESETELIYLPLSFGQRTDYAVYVFWSNPAMSDEESFDYAYALWRDYLPRASERLAVAIKESYREAAFAVLSKAMHELPAHLVPDRTRPQLEQLAMLYPEPLIRLQQDSNQHLPQLTIEPNPFFGAIARNDIQQSNLKQTLELQLRSLAHMRTEARIYGHYLAAHNVVHLASILDSQEMENTFLARDENNRTLTSRDGTPSLRYTLNDANGLRDTGAESMLGYHCSLLSAVSKLIVGAGSLAEISANQGLRPEKHLVQSRYKSYNLMQTANVALRAHILSPKGRSRSFNIYVDEQLRSVTCSTGSISFNVVASIMYELIGNACKHGAPWVRIGTLPSNRPGFRVSSPLPTDAEMRVVEGVPHIVEGFGEAVKAMSFLHRLTDIQQYLDLRLTYPIDAEMYNVDLEFISSKEVQ